MSTARMTFGTVLGTVSDAAVAVSTTLGAGIKGINMLDEFVTVAALKQKARNVVEVETFAVRLQEEVAMEEVERQIKLVEFTSKSDAHKAAFEASFDRIGALLAKHKIGMPVSA
jgi:hypothetical protein